MNAQGYSLTSEQCENKYKAMKRKFSNFKLQQARSGAGKKDIEFEEELEELFGNHAEVQPTFLLTANESIELPIKTSSTRHMPPDQQQSQKDKKNKKFKGAASTSAVENLCESIILKLDQASKEREDMKQLLQKQHEERMERQDKFLELFSKSLNK